MQISEGMKKILEARGYDVKDFENADKISELSGVNKTVFDKAKEIAEDDINHNKSNIVEPEKEKNKEILDKEKEDKRNKNWNTKVKEGQTTMTFATNQIYQFDKASAMDMAASFAKANGLSVAKVQKAVAEVVEERSDAHYDNYDMREETKVNDYEDYYLKPEIEEKEEEIEEENDRFAYPEMEDRQLSRWSEED